MIQTIKYRLLTLLDDKFFIGAVVLLFVAFNYSVFISSGMLSAGNGMFNEDIKRTLLINNYIIGCNFFGLIVAVYTGSGTFGKDVDTGQIYVILSSFPKRYKYYWGNWITLAGVIFQILMLLFLNLFLVSTILDVSTSYSVAFDVSIKLFMNMLIIMSITFVASAFMKGYRSSMVGFLGLILYNVYSFMNIPIVNIHVELSDVMRRIHVMILPITNIIVESDLNIVTDLYRDIQPLIIPNKVIYQVVYLFFVLILCQLIFERKDI